ncbi:uncharacterized protein LOC141905676 [Tubulanus polymorphus]|uniref:uncharacterized protein LOC141905676 n=1 Tax=Tubulanus polymorphus TaxID=672921 RepID=UPI003DA276F9
MHVATIFSALVGLLVTIQAVRNEKRVGERPRLCYEGGYPGHFTANIPSFLNDKTVTIQVHITTERRVHTRWLVKLANHNFYTLQVEGVTIDRGTKLATNLTLTVPPKYESRSTYKLEITLTGHCNDYVHELIFPTTEVAPAAVSFARFPVAYTVSPRVQFIEDGLLTLRSLVIVSPWGSGTNLEAAYAWRRKVDGEYVAYPAEANQTESGRVLQLPDQTKTYKRRNTALMENPPKKSDLGTYCLVPKEVPEYYTKGHHMHSRMCSSLVRRSDFGRITNITVSSASGSRLVDNHGSKTLALLEGENDMVIFEVTAYPQAYVRLMQLAQDGTEKQVKLDQVIHQDGYSTVANFVGFVDGTKYRIDAGYRSASAYVEFSVFPFSAVKILEKADDSIVLSPEIEEIEFPCTVKNTDSPTIEFFKIYGYPDLEVKNWNKLKMIPIAVEKDKRMSITNTAGPDNLITYTLKIMNVNERDAGEWTWYYMCLAKNRHGSSAGRVLAVLTPWDGSIDYLYSTSED